MRMKNTQRPGPMTRNPLDNVQIVPNFIFHVRPVHVASVSRACVLSVLGTRKKAARGQPDFVGFVHFSTFAKVARSFRNCPNSPDL